MEMTRFQIEVYKAEVDIYRRWFETFVVPLTKNELRQPVYAAALRVMIQRKIAQCNESE
jgi:protein associated with RNAse G/E